MKTELPFVILLSFLLASCTTNQMDSNDRKNESVSTASNDAKDKAVDNTESNRILDIVCSRQKCREANTVALYDQEGNEQTIDLPKVPIIIRDFVDLINGETLLVQAEKVGQRLSLLRVVDEIKKPEKTLRFSLRQVELLPGQYTMLLQVDNPFNNYFKYQARFQTLGSNEFFNTVTCAAKPLETTVESFPFPIVQVLLSEFQLTNNDDLCLGK